MEKIFTVYDKKAQSYSKLMQFPNKAVALRAFGEAMFDPEKFEPAKHPNDYNIWILGEWDPQKGELKAYSKPELLEELVNLKKDKPNG